MCTRTTEPDLIERDRRIVFQTGVLSLGCLAVTSGYAIVRYVIFGPVPGSQFPVYLLNKSVAWRSLSLVCIALSIGALSRISPRYFGQWMDQRKFIGISGFALATVHVMMSLSIMTPAYYPSFFDVESPAFTPLVELTIAMGTVSWILLFTLVIASIPSVQMTMSRRYWLRWQYVAGMGAALLGGGHVLYGFSGWWAPGSWYGGLPPITFLSLLAVVVMLLVRQAGNRLYKIG